MKVGESHILNYPEDKLNGIPFDIIRIKNGIYTFFKKRGDTEVRMDITEDQFHHLYENSSNKRPIPDKDND